MKRLILGTLIAALALVPALGTHAAAGNSIDIVASNWQFTPNSAVLHVGQTTTINFISKEGVHGVQSEDLGIPTQTLIPGKTVSVTVTPTKPGTYVIHCHIACGPGHAAMVIKLTVVS